jgi:hypothetical protein
MKRLLLAVVVLAASVSAYASPLNMQFIGFRSGGWQAGYPYQITEDGNLINMMCDDWLRGGQPGDTWQANFTNLGTGNLSLLRFNQMSGALTLYQEAGWLMLQTEVTTPTQWTDINFAVWHIFDTSVSLTPSQRFWFDSAQKQALQGFPGVDFSMVGIYTPVDQYDQDPLSAQEFLTLVPASVPEPGTLVLLCSGIVGIVARKLRS